MSLPVRVAASAVFVVVVFAVAAVVVFVVALAFLGLATVLASLMLVGR